MADQCRGIAGERCDSDAGAVPRQPVAGMVGRNHPEPGLRQRALAVEGFAVDGPAVQQQQRPAVAGFAPARQGAMRRMRGKGRGGGAVTSRIGSVQGRVSPGSGWEAMQRRAGCPSIDIHAGQFIR
ncbi:hypothetical protein D3C72_1642780 [compost metagenome]